MLAGVSLQSVLVICGLDYSSRALRRLLFLILCATQIDQRAGFRHDVVLEAVILQPETQELTSPPL